MTDRSTGPVRPASRYGRPQGPSTGRGRIALWLGILVAAICVALAAVAYQRYEPLDVEGQTAKVYEADKCRHGVTDELNDVDAE